MIGGMGVDISTSELALEAARLGGIGHISDAMVEDVSDRRSIPASSRTRPSSTSTTSTTWTSRGAVRPGRLAEAQRLHIGATMKRSKARA
jgi:NAD(P)H-dependent flavin oxidoreductase YrpB (nitropropane dioxygenase family)